MNLSNRDRKVLSFLHRQAIDVPPVKSSRITAAVVIKNQIISTGFNQMRTHPFQDKYKKNEHAIWLHGEVSAIRNALNHLHANELQKATLYIYRVKRSDDNNRWIQGLAKPCIGCVRCITEFNIKKVIYSTNTDGEYAVL